AGSLVDSYNRPVPRAYIQVLAADGSGGKPIEMAVENGYFVVPGLSSGKAYMLTARTADGERRLAGRVQATPPNAKVVIKVSEDLYAGNVPPPPAPGDGSPVGSPRIGRPDPAGGDRTRLDDGNGWRPDAPPGRGGAPTG